MALMTVVRLSIDENPEMSLECVRDGIALVLNELQRSQRSQVFDESSILYYPSVREWVMRKCALLLLAVVVVAVGSLAGGYLTRPVHTTPAAPGADEDVEVQFQEAIQTVEDNYAGQTDLETVGKTAIQGMLRTLDPHSAFYTKAEFDDLQNEQRSHFYGIGVNIKRVYNRVYILSVNPDGPPYRAGLRYGDAVVAVDGQNAEDKSTEEIMDRVRGEKGEFVTLTVERAGAPRPITVHLTRSDVKRPTVRLWFMLDRTGTGYIGLTGGFSSKTDEELSAAIADLKQHEMRQLILDLRGNPGGLLDQAIKVAEEFLPPGEKIVEVRGRDDQVQDRVYETPDNNSPEMMPLVILINHRTASASEVVAGALQDHSRAEIVGENSFGKGLVQTIIPLWGGTGLTLTTQRYYTPTGRSIQRDYSKISFYDYYLNRREDSFRPAAQGGNVFHTDLGREVYGGGGITPDKFVKSADTSAVNGILYDGAFHFVRQLAAGLIPGLREYRVTSSQYKTEITQDDINRYPVSDKVLSAFRSFIAENPQFNLPEERLSSNLDYAKALLRREIMTAAYGAEAGEEAFLSDDPQLRRALEVLPEARQLAENSRHEQPRQQ
jgi:carboxyl-terminal processing protease